jgi:hypothetical protein
MVGQEHVGNIRVDKGWFGKDTAKDTDDGPAASIPADKTGLAVEQPKSLAIEAGRRDGKIFPSGVACGSLRPIGTGSGACAFGATRIGLPDAFQFQSAKLERDSSKQN